MNMKKTIAAVAACAMAVSAMATTVSAVSEGAEVGQSVKYNLTLTKETKDANLNFKVTGFDVGGDTITGIAVIVESAVVSNFDDVITITYKPTEDGAGNPVNDGQTKTFTFTTNKDSADYDGVAKKVECGTETAAAPFKVESAKKEAYFVDFTTTTAGAELAAALALPGDLTVSVKLKDSKVDQKGLSANIDEDNDAVKTPSAAKMSMRVAAVTNTAGAANSPVVKVGDKEWFVDTDATAAGNAGLAATNKLAETGYDFTLRGTVNKGTSVEYMPSSNNVKSTALVPEIFNRLDTKGSRGVDKKYDNAKAVVNDMIANYDEVTFTFNTAKEKVNDKDYSVFPQQLYNLFGDEDTKYVYAAEPTYTFHNLFNAALVANNDLTMNQSSIAPLVFNKSSVVFEWNTMKNTDLVVSPAAAIQTLQLATSDLWYWESMEVTGYNVSTEDTESQAPIPADEEDLDDTDAEIDDTDAADDEIDDTDDADADADTDTGDVDDTDDADADDTTDEGDAAADEGNAAADETTGNPETGNAPIALAVIPVALAAAAVVAKKRG